MFRKVPVSCRRVAIGCCFLIVAVGCGKKSTGPKNRANVSGNVTFNGKPLPAGNIIFRSAERSEAAPIMIYDGAYSTDRAPIGKNSVTIDTSSVKYGNPKAYVAIPERYTQAETSQLSVDVQPGDSEDVNFELKN